MDRPAAPRPDRAEPLIDPRRADDAVRFGLRVAAAYAWRLIVLGAAVYLVFVILGRLQLVAVAVFGALVVTALLRPLAEVLGRVLPRELAVAGALVVGLAGLGGALAYIAGSVAGQFGALSGQLTSGAAEIERWLREGPLHVSSAQVTSLVSELQRWLSENQGTLVAQAVGGASAAIEVLTGGALAIFCAVFLIASGDRLWQWALAEVPGYARPRLDAVATAAWSTFAGYTRGIVVVAASNAALVCVALLVLRVPLAVPLSMLTFFAAFVPLIGSPLALLVATVVALAGRGPVVALLVLLLTVLIGQFEGHLLHPMVMSRAVNVHPVVVAVSVASGAVLAGIVGAVVAVPLVSVAWSIRTALRAEPPRVAAPDPPIVEAGGATAGDTPAATRPP